MVKKSRSKTFWQHIKFNYKLSILNEKTLEEVFTFRLSLLSVIQASIALFIITLLLVSSLIATTPIKNYLPGYLDVKARNDIVKNALKLDSMEAVIALQEKYLNQVKSVLSGNIHADSLTTKINTLTNVDPQKLKASKKEIVYRNEYEEEEKYNLSLKSLEKNETEDITFIRPSKGVVSSNYDLTKKQHGIALLCESKSPILAIQKGDVILTGMQENGKQFIQILHPNGFISIYKNCEQILKPAGSSVRCGEAIANTAIISKNKSENPFIFELWLKGKPVNPSKYIVF